MVDKSKLEGCSGFYPIVRDIRKILSDFSTPVRETQETYLKSLGSTFDGQSEGGGEEENVRKGRQNVRQK